VSYPLTALISDLHGNLPAVTTAVRDARERGARRFVCLGDVVGYGARPRECLDIVMELCTERAVEQGLEPGRCLLGNHEQALLGSGEDFNPNARRAIDWTREQLLAGGDGREGAMGYWDFLGGLEPLYVEEGAMYAHGTPRDPVREYLLPRDARDAGKMAALFTAMGQWADRGAHVCFVGHSHVPAIYYEDGRFYRPRDTEGPYDLGDLSAARAIVNVGSVGQPRDGDPRLSYALYDGRNLTMIRLTYDVGAAQADIRAVSELPAYLAERLARGQ
jgi:diadenosine tetraphosphatase ApaH/serine/threonine PP2A family protein phosphatase